jgi:hypothetical protein
MEREAHFSRQFPEQFTLPHYIAAMGPRQMEVFARVLVTTIVGDLETPHRDIGRLLAEKMEASGLFLPEVAINELAEMDMHEIELLSAFVSTSSRNP